MRVNDGRVKMIEIVIEVLFWFTVFLGTSGLLFCSVYTLILFADLSVDHINPIELCDYINRLVLPEYVGHAALSCLIFLHGHIVVFLFNLPLILFHIRRYINRNHLLHSTSVFNDVEQERVIAQVKLGYHLIMFFVYLYLFIVMLIAD